MAAVNPYWGFIAIAYPLIAGLLHGFDVPWPKAFGFTTAIYAVVFAGASALAHFVH